VIFVHFGFEQAPSEPAGAPLAHSESQGFLFDEIWGFKGGLRAPIGDSLRSLFVDLCALW